MSICLSYMYIACKQSTVNLRLLGNLMPSRGTWTVWRAMLIGLSALSKLVDCSSH